jgi:dTDP-4-dehydrorhamnose reductase
VISDQTGRLTFTSELARATRHLLDTGAPFGTYNLTNAGDPMSWADIARLVFERCGRSGADVTDTTTEEWGRGKQVSPRPLASALDLSKIEATGFTPEDQLTALDRYLRG